MPDKGTSIGAFVRVICLNRKEVRSGGVALGMDSLIFISFVFRQNTPLVQGEQ